MYSLVSVFCSSHFSVKPLKFEINVILCQYSYNSFIFGSKNKNKFGEINFLDCNFLSSSYGNESKKFELWEIYHAEYGSFFATDWLKKREVGRSWSKSRYSNTD